MNNKIKNIKWDTDGEDVELFINQNEEFKNHVDFFKNYKNVWWVKYYFIYLYCQTIRTMGYIYTFIKTSSLVEKEVEAINIWDAAKKLKINIVRADRLSNHYLASTPFDERERTVWAPGLTHYIVKQRRKKAEDYLEL